MDKVFPCASCLLKYSILDASGDPPLRYATQLLAISQFSARVSPSIFSQILSLNQNKLSVSLVLPGVSTPFKGTAYTPSAPIHPELRRSISSHSDAACETIPESALRS